MTPGELKFALTLEDKLNSLPDPEYRQLVVEALIIFSFLAKSKGPTSISHGPLVVDDIIKSAQHLFLEDQVSFVMYTVCGPLYNITDWRLCGAKRR